MKKQQIMKILRWSTIALIIPIIGQLFVDGWNWGILDFAFAWVFFNIVGFVYTFATHTVISRTRKIIVGIIVIAVFAFIWVTLATG